MGWKDKVTPSTNIVTLCTESNGTTIQYTREAITIIWITENHDSIYPILNGRRELRRGKVYKLGPLTIIHIPRLLD
jgi:hypothetical protein